MICANCGSQSFHVKITREGERCHNCGGFAEASGSPTDNAAGSSAFRIRTQQAAMEGDMLPAHHYDPVKKRVVPNPEFIKRHPQTARYHYSPDELKKEGMHKLAKTVEDGLKVVATKDPDVKFSGSTKAGIKKAIKNAK